jgi:L-lactate dehydrogenase complex protein LldE
MSTDIQLFATCLIDTLFPEIGEAVVSVLERAGARVHLPAGQTCCGQPAFNAGLRGESRKLAEHTLHIFDQTSGPIVVPSGSCAAMIRHGYLELFAEDSKWLPIARSVAARTFEFSEFLVDQLGVIDTGAYFRGRICYHASCHVLRDIGVDTQPRALLQSVHEAEIVELNGADECCGFGGVFSVEHPEISAEMLNRKLDNIKASDAQVVVACDSGCIANINGGFNRRGEMNRAHHIAEILDQRVDVLS